MAQPRRRLSADVRREQILEAGARLFIERGFDNVKMADIAEQLRTSRPNIYTYYPSTDAVLDAILEQRYEGWLDRLATLIRGKDDDQVAIFSALLQERELVLLLNSGGGPGFQARRQRLTQSFEARFAARLPPALLETQPLLVRLLRSVSLGFAYELLQDSETYDAGAAAELFGQFLTGGVLAVIPNIEELLDAEATAKAGAAQDTASPDAAADDAGTASNS